MIGCCAVLWTKMNIDGIYRECHVLSYNIDMSVLIMLQWRYYSASCVIIWMEVWIMNFIFPYLGNVTVPTDELIFFRGVETTNQIIWPFTIHNLAIHHSFTITIYHYLTSYKLDKCPSSMWSSVYPRLETWMCVVSLVVGWPLVVVQNRSPFFLHNADIKNRTGTTSTVVIPTINMYLVGGFTHGFYFP